jgi:hypothetical protein
MPEGKNIEKLRVVESSPAEQIDLDQSVEGAAIESGQDLASSEAELVVSESVPGSVAPAAPGQTEYKNVEGVLEEDLGDIFFTMPPEKQQEFKTEGEKVTRNIMVILQKPKIKVKSIIKLIIDWLKMLPGVNQFFLEQTAKIKADKILDTVGGQDKKVIR